MPLQRELLNGSSLKPLYQTMVCISAVSAPYNKPLQLHSHSLFQTPVLKPPFQEDILGRTLNIISRHFQFYIIRIERLSSRLQVLACYINKFTGISNALQKSDSNYKRLLNIFVAKVPGIAGILNSPF